MYYFVTKEIYLEEIGLLEAKLTNSSMDDSIKFTSDEGDYFEDHKIYRRLVGKLNYLTGNSTEHSLSSECSESIPFMSTYISLGGSHLNIKVS